MSGLTRRHAVMGGALVLGGLGAGLGGIRRAPHDSPDLETLLPRALPGWSEEVVENVVLPPTTGGAQRSYEQVVTRRYSGSAGATVTLVVAYQGIQTFASQVHRPEVCYPASNFSVTAPEPLALPLGSARTVDALSFQARRAQRRDAVLYWTRIGPHFPLSLCEQRRHIARSAVVRSFHDGVVLRVSTAADPTGEGAARDRMVGFHAALYAALGAPARAALFGS